MWGDEGAGRILSQADRSAPTGVAVEGEATGQGSARAQPAADQGRNAYCGSERTRALEPGVTTEKRGPLALQDAAETGGIAVMLQILRPGVVRPQHQAIEGP